LPRPAVRFRGSKQRLRALERRHGRQVWWILLTMLFVEAAAVLTWAIVFSD
jgi:hypothetical protein